MNFLEAITKIKENEGGNDKIIHEICDRMQRIDNEMNVVLGMVSSLAFPNNIGRRSPVCGITLLRKAASTRTKISAFRQECEKRANF